MTNLTQRQDEILEAIGTNDADWDDIAESFVGKSENEIAKLINGLFPTEENEYLIGLIIDEF